jgi:hypothetical protein
MEDDKFFEDYGEVKLHWLKINDLEKYHLYPEFIKTELKESIKETKWFVTKDEKTSQIYLN